MILYTDFSFHDSSFEDLYLKCRLWQEQVHQFFSKTTSERTWSQLSELKVWCSMSCIFYTCIDDVCDASGHSFINFR